MSKYIFLIFFVCISFSWSGPVHRTPEEIQEYEDYLRSSVEGDPIESGSDNVWENSGKFEGDIILTEEQIQMLVDEYGGVRNGVISPTAHWPDNTVVYGWDGAMTDVQIQAVTNAMILISNATCIIFKERTNEVNYAKIRNTSPGCSSHVGYVKGAQTLNLASSRPGSGCYEQRVILHELLHTIGFYHMQSAYDRDDWVRIVYDKIKPGYGGAFSKQDSSVVSHFGEIYDYGSVLHYSEVAFSIDGNKTMIALQPTNGIVIGRGPRMTMSDIIKVNKSYNCPEK